MKKAAPKSPAELWEIIKDQFIAYVIFDKKRYTKEEIKQLAINL